MTSLLFVRSKLKTRLRHASRQRHRNSTMPLSGASRDDHSVRRHRYGSFLSSRQLSSFFNYQPLRSILVKLELFGFSWSLRHILLFVLFPCVLLLYFFVYLINISTIYAVLFSVLFTSVAIFVSLRRILNNVCTQFLTAFPDAVDLIVRGIRSGLPISEAIHNCSVEFDGVVQRIFSQIAGNLNLGVSLNEALAAVSRHLDVQEFRFFVVALAVQQEAGGNVAEILQNLSTLMRRRQQMRSKIKAMSSEARASALIIGSLPLIMLTIIYATNPDYILKFFYYSHGIHLLSFGFVSLITGFLVMKKMSNFEI